jgi:hypothetical protein
MGGGSVEKAQPQLLLLMPHVEKSISNGKLPLLKFLHL